MAPITIVGGGIAGLTLGILLRRAGVPVRIYEAGCYPRHRVCGEFISGRGLDLLRRQRLLPILEQNGAREGRSVEFFSGGRSAAVFDLPSPALCISRYQLDAVLAHEFAECGGELHENFRWTRPFNSEGVVRATGRRLSKDSGGSRLIGIKAHARDLGLSADIEMHFGEIGYAGVCNVDRERANICGLLRTRTPIASLSRNWREILGSMIDRNARIDWDENSFCAVAGFSLSPDHARPNGECRLGDSITMIPPLTGNGMSIAFESAEQALEPLARYSSGGSSWADVLAEIARRANATLLPRLRWANLMQRLLFVPVTRRIMHEIIVRQRWVFPLLFSKTR